MTINFYAINDLEITAHVAVLKSAIAGLFSNSVADTHDRNGQVTKAFRSSQQNGKPDPFENFLPRGIS